MPDKHPGKRPKSKRSPESRKKAAQIANPDSALKEHPLWQIRIFDADGPWGTIGLNEGVLLEMIFDKMKSYESMTWGNIDQNRKLNHYIYTSKLIREARNRLEELKLDDYDKLFSFRLGGTERIWGIREGAIFRFLWWDPEHKIYPYELKHT